MLKSVTQAQDNISIGKLFAEEGTAMITKVMKIWTALLLAVLLAAGCAAGKTESESVPAEVLPVVTETLAEQPDDALPQSGQETPETVRILKLAEIENWHWDYNETGSAEACAPILFLAEDEELYPELSELLRSTGERMNAEAEQQFEEMKDSLAEQPSMQLRSVTGTSVARADSDYLSILFVTDSYLGGAHPDRTFTSLNAESRTGRILRLSDLCSGTESLLFRLGAALQARYPDVQFFNLNAELAQEEKENTLAWTAGYDGITFYFPGGMLAPYSDGDLAACLSWRENADILDPEDFRAPASWAAAFCADLPVFLDLEGSGSLGALQAGGTTYDWESQAFEGVYANLDGFGSSQEAYFYSVRPYLIRTGDGLSLVYLELSSDNDYRSLIAFRVGNGTVSAESEEMGFCLTGADGPGDAYGRMLTFDPEQFRLSTRLDALSTYDGEKTYHIGPDGVPETDDALFRIEYRPTLVTVREVPATDESGAETMLKPGTEFTLLETDGHSVVTGETADGIRAFHGIFDRWPQMIGSLEAEECFEEMFFAG